MSEYFAMHPSVPYLSQSDGKTTAQEMFNQGQEMFTWIPNAYIKYPCTAEGLRAAPNSVKEGMRVNMTLRFSPQQAAGVFVVLAKDMRKCLICDDMLTRRSAVQHASTFCSLIEEILEREIRLQSAVRCKTPSS